jgi:curved DNA-binding protein CbpA
MVSDGHTRHDHGSLRWPEITPANAIPTPYQIFNQKKGSPYSKKRFYELVKLYHPDRHDPDDCSGLPYATKLERYRLVVAANDLLSDPVKRGAYDIYGAGWNGQPDVLRPRDSSEQPATWGGHSERGWGGGPSGPSQNATWEDWEKWYQREGKGPQEPRYVSNAAFVGLILAFAALGGMTQATRAGNYSISFLEQRDALHRNVSKDLMRRRKEAMGAYGSREERIESFLKQRDPYGHSVTDPKEESYRRVLPPPEICSSENIKDRSMDIYHQKNNPKDG